MSFKVDLDTIDWKILKELQQNGRMTNVELASKVDISAPPCLRRVRRLEREGVIKSYRAMLNGELIGQALNAFCSIGLHSQAEADLCSFSSKAMAWPYVRKAWLVSGESDFMLFCVAPSLSDFQNFVMEQLTTTPNVASVRTALSIKTIKEEPDYII